MAAHKKRWYERSAVRNWMATVVIGVVAAWAGDVDLLAAVKDRAVEWIGAFFTAIGFTAASQSGKVK